MVDDHERTEYVTIGEAARLLGLSVRTLARWVEQGHLPCVVISGETLLLRKDVETKTRRPRNEESEDDEADS